MAMVAAACFAQGTSRFVNIENLRYKESDRISDYCRILTRMGAQVEETADSIIVHGTPDTLPGGSRNRCSQRPSIADGSYHRSLALQTTCTPDRCRAHRQVISVLL